MYSLFNMHILYTKFLLVIHPLVTNYPASRQTCLSAQTGLKRHECAASSTKHSERLVANIKEEAEGGPRTTPHTNCTYKRECDWGTGVAPLIDRGGAMCATIVSLD